MKKFQLLCLWFLVLSGNAQYKSLLWKISGNGLAQPSYLFGTMHTNDTRVFAAVDRAMPYFSVAKAYAMELDPDKSLDIGLLEKLMMGKEYSLKKMIPEKEYKFLDSVSSRQIGFSLAMFDNIAPVFVMTVLESSEMGLSDSIMADKEVMDLYLFGKAKEEKKKIIGIETADEQIKALNALSYQEQADLLVEEVHSFETNKDEGKGILRFYIRQDLDSLAANDNDSQMPPKFFKAIVTDRNKRMANRISGSIQEQATFIAIGALHLPGKHGLVELLRDKGFNVEAVKN